MIDTILNQWKSLQQDLAKQEIEQKAKQIEEAQGMSLDNTYLVSHSL